MGKMSKINGQKEQENFLTPVSLLGIVVPKDAGQGVDFKLVTLSGVEYSLVTDLEWKQIFESYRWEEVRVRGLLNPTTMTIVPQWVLPRGPTGETQRVSDEPLGKDGGLVSKIRKTVADLILVPAYA